jgi:hypothetical protein
MCSIILNITPEGVFIAANRDEMLNRPWRPPGRYWADDIIAGKDETGGGTWLGINRQGVVAAVLNRHGSLGPAPGKRSRGELPLLALAAPSAAAAADRIAALDAGDYRSFNLVTADRGGAYLVRGLGAGGPDVTPFKPGVTMLTAGEPNDLGEPRIARHLPKFQGAAWPAWERLLIDGSAPRISALSIPPGPEGFGTVCSSLLELPAEAAPSWRFAAAGDRFAQVGLF